MGDKNAFGVTPDPLGCWGHSGKPPGVKLKLHQIKTFSKQKMLGMFQGTKNELGVTPWGPLGTQGIDSKK